MSILLDHFSCSKCASTWPATDLAHRYYLLPTGVLLDVESRYAWCMDCRRMREAEKLPDPGELAAIIRLRPTISKQSRWWPFGRADREKCERERALAREKAQQMLNLVLPRKSPPRCLGCGSSQIVNPDKVNLTLHPDCGGVIRRISSETFVSFASPIPFPTRFYNAEGEFIRESEGSWKP